MADVRDILCPVWADTSRPQLLGPFVEHYRTLGIRTFIILILAPSWDDPGLPAAITQLRSLGIKEMARWVGAFSRPEVEQGLHRLINAHAIPGDWVLDLKIDEFIQLEIAGQAPLTLKQLIRRQLERGRTSLIGRVADMVAADGNLTPLNRGTPLYDQYPIACNLTAKLRPEQSRKVVAYAAGSPKRPPTPAGRNGPHSHDVRVLRFAWDRTATTRPELARLRAAQRDGQRRILIVRGQPKIDLHPLEFVGRYGPLGGWSISSRLLKYMVLNVPLGSAVLELGSGAGTRELAHFYRMHSIEHDERWVGRFNSLYTHAPINDGWYDTGIVKTAISGSHPAAILVDGPPARIGRHGFARNLNLFDTSGWLIFDDVHRPDDLRHFHTVRGKFPTRSWEIVRGDRKSFGVIRPATLS